MSGTTKVIIGQVEVKEAVVRWTSKRPYHINYSSQEKEQTPQIRIDFNITKSTHDEKKIMVIPLFTGEWISLFAAIRHSFVLNFGFINKLFSNFMIKPDKEINLIRQAEQFTCLSGGQAHLFS